MYIKHNVSVLALLTALAASPAVAQVDLSIGGDDGVGVNLDTSDGIEADAQVGGDDDLDVNADVGTGDGGTSVDADVDIGSGGDGDGSVLDTDVNLDAGGDDSLVDLDANVDVLEGGDDDPLVDVDASATVGGSTGGDLLSLGDGQSDALIALLGDSGLAGVNLDAVVDDTQVAVINVNDVLSEESLADIEIALLSGETAGMDEAQAAVEASVTLSTILAGEGLSASDVLAVEVGPEGEASIYVLPGGVESLDVAADVDIAGEDVADADVSLLGDDEAASADVSILPGAEGDDAGDGSETGAEVDLDVDLGDTDVADVEADVLSDDDLASADLVILPGDDDTGDGGAGDGTGAGDDDGTGDGDTGTGTGTGTGSDDDDGATGGSDASGDTAGSSGDASGSADSDVSTGTAGDLGDELSADAQAGVATDGTMPCPADLRAFLQNTATASAIRSASSAEVVLLIGCTDTGLIAAADFSRLRDVIEAHPVTRAAVEATADVSFDDIVSASVSGDTVTLYAIADE